MADMIYLPDRVFSLWDSLGGALIRAAHEAMFDFDKNNPKPWAYYPGVAGGVLVGQREEGVAHAFIVAPASLHHAGPDRRAGAAPGP